MTSWSLAPVDSVDDAMLEPYVRLTDVQLRSRWEQDSGIFIAEGHLVMERARLSGLEFVSVLTTHRWLDRLERILGDWAGVVYVADEALLRTITGFTVHRGALAAVRRPPPRAVVDILAEPGHLLILEDLVDATNVGLAIRSAVALGVPSVIVSPTCADPLYRRAVKSSMGAVMSVRWARSRDWNADLAAVAAGRHMIALTPSGRIDLHGALQSAGAADVAILVGSEGPGLTPAALQHAADTARIPMHADIDSLNVAAATAVACYALTMSRRTP